MFLLVSVGIQFLLFVFMLITVIRVWSLRRGYKAFMEKLGEGNNLETMLKSYISKVEETQVKNQELASYCDRLDQDIAGCVQKVGIVRYSAFKDVGSDLSFAVALLDRDNNGIVFNGIYSIEASNIYAKPVVKGASSYHITEEEQKAIVMAMNVEKTYKVMKKQKKT